MRLTPEIVRLEAFEIYGKSMDLSLTENRIAELWKEFSLSLMDQGISAEVKFDVNLYPEDYFHSFIPTKSFTKWAGIKREKGHKLPMDWTCLSIPAGNYACFHYQGKPNNPAIFQYIFQSWLPSSEYIMDQRPHVMILGPNYHPHRDDSCEDIYLPIRKK